MRPPSEIDPRMKQIRIVGIEAYQGKLSVGAQAVINSSVCEALNLGHSVIDSEHLLLGLISRTTNPAASDLLEKARNTTLFIFGQGIIQTEITEIPFGPLARRLMEQAAELAEKDKNGKEIKPSHLLEALLKSADQGIAFGVLESLGLSPKEPGNVTYLKSLIL